MGVEPKIGGKPPKWMVKIMENPIKMDDLGGTIIFGNIYIYILAKSNLFVLVYKMVQLIQPYPAINMVE